MTIMLMPFISCNARLPVYALLAGLFFPKHQSLVIMGIYFLGIVIAMLVAIFLGKTFFKSENTTFMMEIPPYRLPEFRSVMIQTWEKVKGFLIKAGTILLGASIVIWIVQSFTPQLALAERPDESILAAIGRSIAPIFAPLGFGNWESATALLIGIPAKEMIVSALAMFAQSQGQQGVFDAFLTSSFSVAGALSFMSFSLMYMPCLSTIVVMKRELNSWKWTLLTLGISFGVAWVVSWLIYSIVGLWI